MRFEGIRMACQQLTETQFETPEDLVAWMGALQAQDYTMSKWAIGLRLKSATVEEINKALAEGEIIRTHIMRPTWHYVAGKDLRWMWQLTSPRVRKTVDVWIKASGVDIPKEVYVRCNDLIGRMLQGKRSLTREEIGNELERIGIITSHNRMKCYILRAEMEGIICSGADRNGKPTYALLDEQVPWTPVLPREEALARLALRYFQSHSPATVDDFIWWSGLTATEAKQAIGALGDQLIKEHFGEREFWVHASCREAKEKEVIHFLPPFDEYLISYKDRSPVIPIEHHPKAFNRWGIFYPVILYNGQIIGNWNKIKKKKELIVNTSFFDEGITCRTGLLHQAEDHYRNFCRYVRV